MRLYIVRWPNLSAALVAARSEECLIDILDEIDNPSVCTWERYNGPLFLDFELIAQARVEDTEDETNPHDQSSPHVLNPSKIKIKGMERLVSGEDIMKICAAGETGQAMLEAVSRQVFPATARAYWDRDSEIPDEAELESALRDDAMRMVEASWQFAQMRKSSDPDVQFALQMDASVEWCKSIHRLAGGDDADDREMELEDQIDATLDLALDEWGTTQDTREVRLNLLHALCLLEQFETIQIYGSSNHRTNAASIASINDQTAVKDPAK